MTRLRKLDPLAARVAQRMARGLPLSPREIVTAVRANLATFTASGNARPRSTSSTKQPLKERTP